MKLKFTIEGLDCANCANELEENISKIEGINSVSISFMSQKMIIETDTENTDELIKKIEEVVKDEEPEVILTLK